MHKLFGNKVQEHSIMKYPAIFLVGGVSSLFLGFLCGIILYYGLGVAALIALFGCGAFLFYECYWANGHSDTYNAVNLALGALFFRSCLPDLAAVTETHPHLNPPPLATREERMEKGEAVTPEKAGKEEL